MNKRIAILILSLVVLPACGGGGGGGGGSAGPPAPATEPPLYDWTTFTASADTVITYVSSSLGNDAWDGSAGTFLGGSAGPKQTIAAGVAQLRDGFPDWLLLRKGDVWFESLHQDWGLSGRDADEPMLISSYGAGARPELRTGANRGFNRHDPVFMHDLAFVGLHFNAHTRNPNSASYVSPAGDQGFRWVGDGGSARILIEDCHFEWYTTNVVVHSNSSYPMYQDVKIRRCVLTDAWAVNCFGDPGCPGPDQGHSQGGFFDYINGLIIEGCVFDHNGGLICIDGDPQGVTLGGYNTNWTSLTWFNHQAYINSGNQNVVVRDNIFANGDGVQARAGGIIRRNVFTKCVNSLTFGPATTPVPGGVFGDVSDNVFLEGTDFPAESIHAGPRANGIIAENIHPNGLLITGNVFSNDISTAHYGCAVSLRGAPAIFTQNVIVENNVVSNWRGGFRIYDIPGTDIANITVRNNDLQNPGDPNGRLTYHEEPYSSAQFSYSGNRYDRGGSTLWHQINGANQTFAQWTAATGETGGQAMAVVYPDATRTVGSYDGTIGGAGTHLSFMAGARALSKDNWQAPYTAGAIIAYIKAGFGL